MDALADSGVRRALSPRRAGHRQVARWLVREGMLVRVALGVMALHVVDDSFLQPQPGTSAGDHLVSGLVPLAVFFLFAAGYSRLRAGLRAFLGLTLGLIGLAGAVGEAGYYSVRVGPSGDDYTGLVALPVALLLVIVCLSTLWRTRRLDGSRLRRYLRRGLLAVGVVPFGALVAFPIALSYIFTHSARAVVPAVQPGASYEHVFFRTSDGLRLEGWYAPSKNRAAVIVSPGRSPSVQRHAAVLVRHRYGVLMFDRRGEGASEGDPNIYGWSGDKDLEGALAFLGSRPDADPQRIGGLGLSVGGEMLLQAAAETPALKAVVSEGAGVRSVYEAKELPWRDKWLQLPLMSVATTATALFSNHGPPASLKELAGRIAPRAVFFIYAGHGAGGEELNADYYRAAGRPKALWKIPEAGHTGGLSARPSEYERRVVTFFDGALLKETS